MVQTKRDKTKKRLRMMSAKKQAEATSTKSSRAFRLPDGVKQFRMKKESGKVCNLNVVPFETSRHIIGADKGSAAACMPRE